MLCLVLVQIGCSLSVLSGCRSESIVQKLVHQKPRTEAVFTFRLCTVHWLIGSSQRCAWHRFWLHYKLGMIVMVYNVIVLAFFFFNSMSIFLIFITPARIRKNLMLCCSMPVFKKQAEVHKIILVWGKKTTGSEFSICNLEHTKHSW